MAVAVEAADGHHAGKVGLSGDATERAAGKGRAALAVTLRFAGVPSFRGRDNFTSFCEKLRTHKGLQALKRTLMSGVTDFPARMGRNQFFLRLLMVVVGGGDHGRAQALIEGSLALLLGGTALHMPSATSMGIGLEGRCRTELQQNAGTSAQPGCVEREVAGTPARRASPS